MVRTHGPFVDALARHQQSGVIAGSCNSLAVSEGGRLFVWGEVSEEVNQQHVWLGLGDQVNEGGEVWVPTLVEGVEGVVDCASGTFHSLLSTRDGTVMSFGSCGMEGDDWGEGTGRPIDGRLGLGPNVGRSPMPTAIEGLAVDPPPPPPPDACKQN